MSKSIYRDIVHAAEQHGLNPKYAASTGGGEHHAACPECGGIDRFILHPNNENANCKGRYWCRQCNISGDFIEFCRKYCDCKSFEEAVELANGSIPATFTKKSITKRSKKTMPSFQPKNPIVSTQTSIKPVSPVWQEQAELLINEAHEDLLNNPDMMEWLKQRGINSRAVKRHRIGWLYEPKRYPGSAWDVPNKEVFIPAGLLIPTFGRIDNKPRRLKVRCKDWHPESTGAKYIAIPGSMEGLMTLGDYISKIVIIVESELDAFAIYDALSDIACVIAIGGNNKNPDAASKLIAQKAEWLFVCHDNDEGGKAMLRKWRDVSKKAIAYPTRIGKDIGEAFALGLNIREFFLAAITPSITQANAAQPMIIETAAQAIVLPEPELSVAQKEKSDDAAVGVPSPEAAEIVSTHNEVVVAQAPESAPTDQPLRTPLNDLSLLKNWAIAYFNGIPDVYMLPSDRRLRATVNTLEKNMISEALQKELRWIYRLVTDNLML